MWTVAEAEWGHEVPIDPRTYEMTASAPGYETWSARIVIVEGQHVPIEIPELVKAAVVADLNVPADTHETHETHVEIVAPPPIVPVARPTVPYHVGVGVLTGAQTDHRTLANMASTNWVNGVRGVVNAAPLGGGMLRIVPEYR